MPALAAAYAPLPDRAHEARARRRVDDAAVDRRARLRLRAPPLGRVACGREVALQVDADHRVPLVLAGGEHHAVAEEAGVVDQHVEPAERVDRGVHEPARAVPVGDVVGVGDGVAAGGHDLVDEELRGALVGAGAVARDAEIVHDDPGTFTRERQRVLAADAARGAGDDDDPAVADSGHVTLLLTFGGRHPTGARSPLSLRRRTVRRGHSDDGEQRMKLEAGKIAVVTGAASGIGFALADRFATAGMHVVLADVDDDGLAAAAEQDRRAGRRHAHREDRRQQRGVGAGARGRDRRALRHRARRVQQRGRDVERRSRGSVRSTRGSG